MRPIYIYRFMDGTKYELLISLSRDELKKLMKIHGAVVVDFRIIKEG